MLLSGLDRHEVFDDATCPYRPACLCSITVPVTSGPAPADTRSPASGLRVQTDRPAPAPPPIRSSVLVVAVTPVVRLARGSAIRPAPDRDHLATEARPGALATPESAGEAWTSCDCQRCTRLDSGDVASESDVGLASHYRRATEAGYQCGPIHGGEVSCPATQAAVADLEELPEQPCPGSGCPRFLYRTHCDVSGSLCACDTDP